MQDISEDGMSATPQDDIPATPEGETVTLNIYFTKNGPISSSGFLFTIQTGGTATGVLILWTMQLLCILTASIIGKLIIIAPAVLKHIIMYYIHTIIFLYIPRLYT